MGNINQLNAFTREQYHDIWVRINAGSLLDEEEQIIGELMKQHKEFNEKKYIGKLKRITKFQLI